MIERELSLIKKWLHSALRQYRIANYSKFGPNHVFNIKVDDVSLKMTFLDAKITNGIVERLQSRREPTTVAIIRALVKPGGKVLELGGCYGYFTNIMASCAGPQGEVVSIEGTPNNFRILKTNIELNNLKNVEAYNVFITDKADHVTYTPDAQDPYPAIDRLLSGGELDSSADVSVPTVRLSSFLPELEFVPDIVFMDIEGFEIEVFKDLDQHYFANHRPMIIFEIHDLYYRDGENIDFIKNILGRHAYYYRKDGSNMLCFPN